MEEMNGITGIGYRDGEYWNYRKWKPQGTVPDWLTLTP